MNKHTITDAAVITCVTIDIAISPVAGQIIPLVNALMSPESSLMHAMGVGSYIALAIASAHWLKGQLIGPKKSG